MTKNKGQATSCRHWGAPCWASLWTRLLNSPDKSLRKAEYNKSKFEIASSLMGPVFWNLYTIVPSLWWDRRSVDKYNWCWF